MNIHDLSAERNCTSCQMCAAVCPKDAISIHLDKEGFYRPKVDYDKCIDCSLCTSVCYKFVKPEETKDDQLKSIPVYAVAAKDENLLKVTSSGGVADILARTLVNQGWLCVGVEYNSQFDDARHKLARTVEETVCFRGSKYIQSYTYDAFKEVIKTSLNSKVAIFGTPCQIYAWDLYLRKRKKRDNFLLIDIYCHGCPSLYSWKKYIKNVRKDNHIKDIQRLTFRSKANGWGVYHIGINEFTSCKRYVSPKVNDKFFSLFFSDHILNVACDDCICRNTLAHTDIRLGDFWGKIYDRNTKGVSIVSCASSLGEKILNEISNEIVIKEHVHQDYLPYQSYGKVYRPDKKLRKEMLESLADSKCSLDDAIKQYFGKQSFAFHIKFFAKNLILRLPRSLVNIIKSIYH